MKIEIVVFLNILYLKVEITVILFYILGAIAIASAVGTVASKHPVVSAVSLVLHFFMLAGMYLTLQAQFVSIMQILVYAGAIMVLVIFVIMLLNLGDEEKLKENINVRKLIALSMGAVLIFQLTIIALATSSDLTQMSISAINNGTVEAIGQTMFTKYIFHFEAISLLLLVAIIGALMLARRKKPEEIQEGATEL